jgi:hypothetical protein
VQLATGTVDASRHATSTSLYSTLLHRSKTYHSGLLARVCERAATVKQILTFVVILRLISRRVCEVSSAIGLDYSRRSADIEVQKNVVLATSQDENSYIYSELPSEHRSFRGGSSLCFVCA